MGVWTSVRGRGYIAPPPRPIADLGQVNEGTSGLQCHKDGCRHLHGAGGAPRDGSRAVVVAEEMPTTKKKHSATSALFFIPSLNSTKETNTVSFLYFCSCWTMSPSLRVALQWKLAKYSEAHVELGISFDRGHTFKFPLGISGEKTKH